MTDNSASFLVRRARVEDAPVIARPRASEEYVGWLGVLKDKPDVIAGGAGVQLRQVAPHPCRPPKEGAFAKGRHAIVLNVFTEPEWRRRGLARLLMEEILRWAGRERLDRLVLHASDEARALY